MNNPRTRSARVRYTATGALAALAAVGAIAGTAALAAKPSAGAHGHAAAAIAGPTKQPTSGVPNKAGTPPPPVNQQPFLDAIHQLVVNGAITATEAQAIDREIQTGRVDTDTLASSGFTATQLGAVQQALADAKRALASDAQRAGAGKSGAAQRDAKTRHS